MTFGSSLFYSIVFEAYSPLGSSGSPLMKEDVVLDIAKKNGVEPGTILLSYLVNRDIVGTYPCRLRHRIALTSNVSSAQVCQPDTNCLQPEYYRSLARGYRKAQPVGLG